MKLKKKIERILEKTHKEILFTFKEITHYIYAYEVYRIIEKKKRNSYDSCFAQSHGNNVEVYIPREEIPTKLFDMITECGWIATKLRKYGYRYFRCYKLGCNYKISYYALN